MEQTKEKKYLFGSILCGLLTAAGIVTTVISLLTGSNGMWALCDCADLLLLFLIIFYAFVGYKKPHGNLLKFIILLRLVFILFGFPSLIRAENVVTITSQAIEIGLCGYIAGRLAKVKENLILMILVTLCVIETIITEMIMGIATIGVVAHLSIWLDIFVAYFLRYKQHREAGLADATKSK